MSVFILLNSRMLVFVEVIRASLDYMFPILKENIAFIFNS
jgi:hypothetical protein